MALLFPGKTPCVLCGRVIQNEERAVGFPAFLPKHHRFHRYSDEVFHDQCFQTWPDKFEFERLYQNYRDIWESRPRHFSSLEEVEAWGKEAFKDLDADMLEKPQL